MNRQPAAQHGQKRMRVGPRHLHLPARDVGQFVEDLHADRAAGGDGRFDTVGLRGISEVRWRRKLGVEKASGHLPHPDQI
jgi:hypothetical protein